MKNKISLINIKFKNYFKFMFIYFYLFLYCLIFLLFSNKNYIFKRFLKDQMQSKLFGTFFAIIWGGICYQGGKISEQQKKDDYSFNKV